MFFKKRKEKKAQELKDQQLLVERKFSEAIKVAQQLEDPAMRIDRLQMLKDAIDAYLREKASGLSDKVGKSKKRSDFVSTSGDALAWGGLIGAVIASGPVGWAGAAVVGGGVAVSLGSMAVGSMRERHLIKKYQEENVDHVGKLNSLQVSIQTAVCETLEKDMEGVVNSLHFPDLNYRQLALAAEKIPGLSQRFNDAVLKRGEMAKEDIKAFLDRAAERKEAKNKVENEPAKPTLKPEGKRIILKKPGLDGKS